MTDIPITISDPARLAVLDSYDILDTEPEQAFDDAVMLARQICAAPVALVSLVASKRQWFKAVSGTELCETPIEQSVCAYALAQSETLVIPDLTRDERTRSNPLVTGEPHIRFYAGAILTSPEGAPLGTVCIVDVVARPGGLTPDQRAGLEALARQVMLLLGLRRAVVNSERVIGKSLRDAEESRERLALSDRVIELLTVNERRLRMAQEAGKIGTFEIDIPRDQLKPSAELCRIFGIPFRSTMDASELEGAVHPDDRHIVSGARGRERGDIPLAVEYRIRRASTGEMAWVSRRAEFVKDFER